MSWSYVLLTTADIFLTIFIIFPLSILQWRGTWQLQEVYIAPTDYKLSYWISFAVGANLCIVELFIQPWLKEKLLTSSRCTYVIISRLHLYIHGWAVLCYWRGLWELLDDCGGKGWVVALSSYAVAQVTLILAKTVRTAVGIPVSLRLDTSTDLLDSDLVFKTHSAHLFHFVFDCLFTQFVIVTSTVIVWQSVSNLLDAFILPKPSHHGDLVSLLAGLVATLVFHAVSYPLSLISAFLDKYYVIKLIFEDIIFIVMTWINLMLWQGAWNLCINYFLSPSGAYGEPLGAWVSHALGTVGLMVMQLFNTVGLHNIERDGIYNGGEGLENTKYIRLLMEICARKQFSSIESSPVKEQSNQAANAHLFSDSTELLSSSLSDDEILSNSEKCSLLCASSHISVAKVVARLTPSETADMSPLFSGVKFSQSTFITGDGNAALRKDLSTTCI